MAIVVRDSRNRSPFWYACYTTADGRRLKKSTKETNQAKAKLIAESLQSAEKMAGERTLTAVRTRQLLSEVLQRVSGERLRVFTVREWFEQFTKKKRKSKSQKTALRYDQMMNEFVAFLGARADLNIAAITEKDILDFRDHREAKGLAPVTLNLDITVLSAGFNAALRQKHISVNPCADIEPLKDKATHKKTFTPEQVSALLEVAQGDWKGLILVAFYTGQRLGDCVNLRWRDIDLHERTIHWSQQQDKAAADVSVIHPQLDDYLLSLPTAKSGDEFLFPTLAQQAQRNISPLSKYFRKLMKQARIEEPIIRERSGAGRKVYGLSFHSFRHTFNSILANADVSEEMRMALTGHKSRDVHRRYTHRELERLREAAALLPRIK
jgi:integrase